MSNSQQNMTFLGSESGFQILFIHSFQYLRMNYSIVYKNLKNTNLSSVYSDIVFCSSLFGFDIEKDKEFRGYRNQKSF